MTMTIKPGLLIALCGAAESGKTTVQSLLIEKLGAIPCDDGRALRDAGKALFGFSESDVITDKGKATPFSPTEARLKLSERMPAVLAALYDLDEEMVREDLGVGGQNRSVIICGAHWSIPVLERTVRMHLKVLLNSYEGRLLIGEPLVVRHPLGDIGKIMDELHGPDFIPDSAIAKGRRRHGADAVLSFGSVRRRQGLVYKRHGGIVIEVQRPGKEIRNDFDRYDQTLADAVIMNDLIVSGWSQPSAPPQARDYLIEQIDRKVMPLCVGDYAVAAQVEETFEEIEP